MRTHIITNLFVAVVIVSAFCCLVYITAQQCYRTAANDPQLQMARDIKEGLLTHRNIAYVASFKNIDATKSLPPFVPFYSPRGSVVFSSGRIHSIIPAIPAGVLDQAKRVGENVLTWQPIPTLRLASVSACMGSPKAEFVVVARSLKEVEIREANLVKAVISCWIICLALIIINAFLNLHFNKQRENENNVRKG